MTIFEVDYEDKHGLLKAGTALVFLVVMLVALMFTFVKVIKAEEPTNLATRSIATLEAQKAVTATATDNCYEGKVITVEMSQSHFSLDLGVHLKDAMNKIKFQIPVSCAFYDRVKIGDNLLKMNNKDSFRWGSFIVEGSVGDWKIVVVAK
jgi:hypothetical protein